MAKRRYLTLIEIMIVIALIGLIGSVVAYNLKGSLNEGKAFKTAQAMEQINDILWLEVAQGDRTIDEVAQQWERVVEKSPLARKPSELCKDGWGQTFTVRAERDEFRISSNRYEQYTAQKKTK